MMEQQMAGKKSESVLARSNASSVLTQKDANQYNVTVKNYAKKATASKSKAVSALKSLGIHTTTGRISKKSS